MKLNKKIITLGSLLAIVTPIVAVISCGKDVQPTEDELKLRAGLDSNVVKNKMQNAWMFKVLSTNSNGVSNKQIPGMELEKEVKNVDDLNLSPEVKDMAIEIISKNIFNKKEFLRNLIVPLVTKATKPFNSANKNAYEQSFLKSNGLLTDYLNGNVTFDTVNPKTTGEVTDAGLKILLTTDEINFKTNLLKALVVKKYLKEVNHELWAKAFPEEDKVRGPIQQLIKDDNFTIINEMISKKLFAQWELAPKNKIDENNFLTTEKNFNDSLIAMKKTGSMAKLAKYSDEKKLMNPNLFKPWSNDNNAKEIYGFKGFVSISSGKGILEYKTVNYKEATNLNKWYGFKTEDNFMDASSTDTFKWKEDGKDVKLNLIRGIMPTYQTTGTSPKTESKLDIASGWKKEDLATFFAVQDESLYATAMNYYLTKKDDKHPAIILNIEDKQIKKYLDKKGDDFKFINERKLEDK